MTPLDAPGRHKEPLSMRVSALRLAVTLAVALVGCSFPPTATRSSSSEGPIATSDPAPTPANVQASLSIEHVIFLVKENRTFDNYFGRFPGANGAATGRLSNGQSVPLGTLPDSIYPD